MNMSYCRFRNTLSDLQDCFDNLPNGDLSNDEANAFVDLVLLAKEIAEQYEEYNENELKDLAIETYEEEQGEEIEEYYKQNN
jgi:polyhydroxyalkanoate synthesis regulator phasin